MTNEKKTEMLFFKEGPELRRQRAIFELVITNAEKIARLLEADEETLSHLVAACESSKHVRR